MTAKAYLKANPEKYVMVGTLDGAAVYVAPSQLSGVNMTSNREEAERWDSLSNTSMRISYFKAATGIQDLSFQIA